MSPSPTINNLLRPPSITRARDTLKTPLCILRDHTYPQEYEYGRKKGKERERKAGRRQSAVRHRPFFFFGQLPSSPSRRKKEKKNNCSPPLVLGLASGSKVRHEVRLCQGLCRDGRRGRRSRSREVESSSFIPRRRRRQPRRRRRQERQTTTMLKQRRRGRSSRGFSCPFAPRRRQQSDLGTPSAGRSERAHRSQRHFSE